MENQLTEEFTSNRLVLFSLKKPITVLMFFLALLVLGVISYTRIPVELLPRGFTDPFLAIFLPYRNANPTIIEEQITRPVEESLSTLRRLKEISSVSSANQSQVRLKFDSGTNMKVAYAQVQDRLDRARLDFPDEVEQERIWKFNTEDTPILFLGISVSEDVEDPFYLLETQIERALNRIDGVAKVDIHGVYQKVIRIDLDPEKIKKHRLNLYELTQFLRKNNFSLPIGDLREGDKQYFVRSEGYFKTLQEIEELPLNNFLKLKDVSTIRYGFSRKDFVTRINLNQAYYCALYKESTANTVDVCKAVSHFLNEEVPQNPKLKGFNCHTLWSQGDIIENSLNNLSETLYGGAILALLVLFIFLRDIKMTILIVLAIPISLLMTLVIMYFNGDTLNLLTMMGMTLGVGMLVDNTVVVVENIDRLKQQGLSNWDASLFGTSQVALAVISSTATTLVVFLPLMLMNDSAEFKFFMTRLGLPVCVSLVASLFVAMVFVPLGSTWLQSKKKIKQTTPSLLLRFGERLFRWIILHRFDSTVLLILLLSSASYPFSQLGKNSEGQSESRRVMIDLELPKHFDIYQTNDVFIQFEKLLYDRRKELDIEYVLSRFSDRNGSIRLFLLKTEEATLSVKEINEKIKALFPKLPGVQLTMNWESEAQDTKIDIELVGPDTQTLEKIANEVKERLRLIPELENIDTTQENKGDELHIYLNRETSFDLGIVPDIVVATISYGLRGSRLPDFKGQDREIPMLIQYEEDEASPIRIQNMTVFSKKGIELPFSAFSTIEIAQAPSEIQRENHKTIQKVTAVPVEGNLELLRNKINQVLAGLELPRGYEINPGSRFRKQDENNEAMLWTFMMSVIFVFLLMGILFESFVLPFSILTSIPFALLGVAWILHLTSTPFEVMSGIGLVILAGIVVNNAIVLVDCINRLRKAGYDRTEAIVQSGIQRLRPILITALTTVVGLIPMAIGQSSVVGLPYSPLGRTVIGGLVASTILTILVIPLFYTFCDDVRLKFMQLTSKFFGKNV